MPPFVGVALNVRDDPAQAGLDPDVSATVTAGVTLGETPIVIELEVAGFPNTPLRFEVIIQRTISPFDRVELEKLALFVPTLIPLICHW